MTYCDGLAFLNLLFSVGVLAADAPLPNVDLLDNVVGVAPLEFEGVELIEDAIEEIKDSSVKKESFLAFLLESNHECQLLLLRK